MKILVTAGNTQTPIDQVRCLTNVFSGRTGASIALEAARRQHRVTLFTSHPEIVPDLAIGQALAAPNWQIKTYRSFDELSGLMESAIPASGFDVVIHAAAVSDYWAAGIFAPGKEGVLENVAAGKVKSHHPELWLKLTPTPKLIDRIREPWGFTGVLVKFKLEVGVSDLELQAIAEKSRLQSQANFMVANTLEGMKAWALLGPVSDGYRKVPRGELARVLLDTLGA